QPEGVDPRERRLPDHELAAPDDAGERRAQHPDRGRTRLHVRYNAGRAPSIRTVSRACRCPSATSRFTNQVGPIEPPAPPIRCICYMAGLASLRRLSTT